MKIAVCMHGQSRTWKKCVANIKKFFDLGPHFEIFYFAHTWGMNTWKRWTPDEEEIWVDEILNVDELYENIRREYNSNFYLTIDEKFQLPDNLTPSLEVFKEHTSGFELAANERIPSVWNSMLYSHMRANHSKQQYEIQNKMLFDLVVSMRFDQCFDPAYNFTSYLPSRRFRPDWLYTEVVDFPYEFYQQALSDTFYFGSSRVMDQIDSFFRIYHNGKFFNLTNSSYYDPALKNIGCGVLLYKWATLKNIHVENINRIGFHIVRENSKIIDGLSDYDLLNDESKNWGIPVLSIKPIQKLK